MGRHSLAAKRRKPSVGVAAAILGPAALFFAIRADVPPPEVVAEPEPGVQEAVPCCLEIIAAPEGQAPVLQIDQAGASAERGDVVSASRWRTVDRSLPEGVAPERGLQVRTILASRAISDAFPQIQNIGGVRADSLRWHPNGLALDVMIPNPTSAEGIRLGNEIVNFVMRNAKRFGIQDAIWRGVYYTPSGPSGSGNGHFDHVHVTTTGGGYPSGGEIYFR
ncbi:hypothetical protein [Mycolicibacterium sp. XJ1819]